MEDRVQEIQLLEARRQWYAAYIDGNVGLLDHIESDDFVLISEVGLLGKLDQLGSIAEAVAGDKWFARGSRAQDDILKLMPFGELVSIYGQGRVVGDARARPSLFFSELWQKLDGQWRVLSLHFTRVATQLP
nr:nuclear transport factor 2 family protein [Halomonas ethanolica]